MIRRYAFLAILLLLASPAAFAMRCGSRIVNVGTQDFQVRDRCGEPFYADTYYATEVFGNDGPVAQYRDVQYDVWYYNFGPNTLMRRFVFRDGVPLAKRVAGEVTLLQSVAPEEERAVRACLRSAQPAPVSA